MPHIYIREELQDQFILVKTTRNHRLFMTNAPQSSIRLVEEIPSDEHDGENKGTHCVVVLSDGVESYISGTAEDFFEALTKSINFGFQLGKQLGEEQMREIQEAQAAQQKQERGRKGILVPRG